MISWPPGTSLSIAFLAFACSEASPDPCSGMCDAAAALYGSCLDGWGVQWEDAGFQSEADYLDACATWAWELRLIERDAHDRGVIEQTGQIDEVCRDRQAALAATDATCLDYTSIDWNTPPWASPSSEDAQ